MVCDGMRYFSLNDASDRQENDGDMFSVQGHDETRWHRTWCDLNTVITIDPGKHECGAAISVDGRVKDARVFVSKCPSKDPLVLGDALFQLVAKEYGDADVLMVERPVHRVRSKKPIRVQDIIDLSVVVGCFNMLAPVVKSVTPKDWKGDLPKDVHHARVAKWLDQSSPWVERALWASLKRAIDHNARDAFALNLFATGRTKRGLES